MSTYVLYRGPSMIDGQPIVALVSGLEQPSANRKTGPMVQTFILRDDMSPYDAIATGADVSICGACPHRGVLGKERSCYVNIMRHGPAAAYRALPGAKPLPKNALRNRAVRLGAYGDPAAVPFDITRDAVKHAALVTGYTHQWRTCNQFYQTLLQASVDSPREREEANAKGWSTFRIKHAEDGRMPGETTCPASDEAGHVMQCITCGLCSGTKRSLDVVINVHGSGKRHFK